MVPYHALTAHSQLRRELYAFVQQQSLVGGRALALPIAIGSTVTYSFFSVLQMVEALALTAIHVVGTLYGRKSCSYRYAGRSFAILTTSLLTLTFTPLCALVILVRLLISPKRYADSRVDHHARLIERYNVDLVSSAKA